MYVTYVRFPLVKSSASVRLIGLIVGDLAPVGEMECVDLNLSDSQGHSDSR